MLNLYAWIQKKIREEKSLELMLALTCLLQEYDAEERKEEMGDVIFTREGSDQTLRKYSPETVGEDVHNLMRAGAST